MVLEGLQILHSLSLLLNLAKIGLVKVLLSFRCVEQINKANRGDLTPEELKQRQAKAMQDPEVQNILSDPVMRQV